MRIGDWSSYVCSSDLDSAGPCRPQRLAAPACAWRQGHDGGRRRMGDRWAVRHSVQRLSRAAGTDQSGNPGIDRRPCPFPRRESEEHTSELQSLMRISYAVFCLTKITNIIL